MVQWDRWTRRELGWHRVLEGMAGYAHSALARDFLHQLEPWPTPHLAESHAKNIAEARRLLNADLPFLPDRSFDDCENAIGRSLRQGILEPTHLLGCAHLAETAMSWRNFVKPHQDLVPELYERLHQIADLNPFATRIGQCFGASEQLQDDASPELAELREKIRTLKHRIQSQLEHKCEDPIFSEYIQDDFVTQRNERFVIPINADFKGKVDGIIHGTSHSGKTLFIELAETISLGNELCILEASAQDEEQRLLAELSEYVAERAADLQSAQKTLLWFDALMAQAQFCDQLNAQPAKIGDRLELLGLKHPSLLLESRAEGGESVTVLPLKAEDERVVANDVILDLDKRLLVIAGPNAGGKTVLMSGIGLAVLLHQCGLAIPARAARLPWFAHVHVTMGDHQDLSAGLSTFSGHLKRLVEADHHAGRQSLILIDEIASGTDPYQGAALAQAILESLIDAGAWVLTTTHLEAVKAMGASHRLGQVGSVALGENQKPTYRFQMGAIGRSGAFAMAAQAGMGGALLERAEALLGGGSYLDDALQAIEQEKAALAAQNAALKQELAAVQSQREKQERQHRHYKTQWEEREREHKQKLAQAWDSFAAEAKERMAALQKSSMQQAQRALTQARQLRKDHQDVAGAVLSRPSIGDGATEDSHLQIRVGAKVYISTLKKSGVVTELGKKHATIRIGAMHTRQRLSALQVQASNDGQSGAAHAKERASGATKKQPKSKVQLHATREPLQTFRIDVRGLRYEDAVSKLERGLDAALLQEQRQIWVIHGHGTGALRKAVREFLKLSPYVDAFRSADRSEGGDGTTIAELLMS